MGSYPDTTASAEVSALLRSSSPLASNINLPLRRQKGREANELEGGAIREPPCACCGSTVLL